MSLRLVTYTLPHSDTPALQDVGIWIGDQIVSVVHAADVCGPLDCKCSAACWRSVAELMACPECLAATRVYAQWFVSADTKTRETVASPIDQVKLLAPVPNPPKLFALAGNYRAHILESQGRGNLGDVTKSDMATPRVFMKPVSNTVCGYDDPILVTAQNAFVDYEAEMAVIIGKGGKCIKREDALAHVGGVTICNDVSERDLRLWERPETREWDRFFDWLLGKWFDNSAPMGPCAVPLEDVGDIGNLGLKLSVNGQPRQESSTSALIFDVPTVIEWISQVCTLETGDIIATGTPSGIGKALGKPLQPGDVVEIELEGVGVLRNPVAAG